MSHSTTFASSGDHHSAHATVRTMADIHNPGPWKISSSARAGLLGMIALGAVAVAVGFFTGASQRTWANILINFFYFMSIGVGGAFFIALVHSAGAAWGAPFRRIAEGATRFLPIAAVVGILILTLGGHTLYHWMDPHAVAHDEVLSAKAGYLNPKFILMRALIFFGIWIGVSRVFVKNSLAQDMTGDAGLTVRVIKWSALFLPLFSLSYSYLSIDFIMSIEPHWFSTMFGVYTFSGLFYSTLAFFAVMTVIFKKRGLLPIVNENHLHDLGKMMFGFSVFWAYIGFSQFMLIWYANIPEETGYYLKRFYGSWGTACWILLIVKFIIPFFALSPRESKRNENHLFRMGIWMLCAHWLDVFIMVMPNFAPEGFRFGILELGIALGFFGLFGFVVSSFWSRSPVLAFRDPRMLEAAQLHQ